MSPDGQGRENSHGSCRHEPCAQPFRLIFMSLVKSGAQGRKQNEDARSARRLGRRLDSGSRVWQQ